MKKFESMTSEGEGLRRAVAWLAEQPVRDAGAVEEASRRFNLSPLDDQFLPERFNMVKPDAR